MSVGWALGVGDRHVEAGDSGEEAFSGWGEPIIGTLGIAVAIDDVEAVVGEAAARWDHGIFADDPVAIEDELVAVRADDNPLAAHDADGLITSVAYRDIVSEGERAVRGSLGVGQEGDGIDGHLDRGPLDDGR
jgi:hypothetical protein